MALSQHETPSPPCSALWRGIFACDPVARQVSAPRAPDASSSGERNPGEQILGVLARTAGDNSGLAETLAYPA